MANEEFIDLLDFTSEKPLHDEDESLSTVIRDDETDHLEQKEQIGERKVIEEEEFTIKLYKKENYIDKIEIDCKCGKSTTINLEYEGGIGVESHLAGEEADGVQDVVEEYEESAASGEESEEFTEFQAGIPAESVNTEPKIDAVGQSDEGEPGISADEDTETE